MNAAWIPEPDAVTDDLEKTADLHPPVFKREWMPLDLTAVLEGSWEPPEPTVGRRTDGVGLFYPGKLHTISSESEAGKTWLALSAVVDEITAGRDVLYLDFEDDEGGVAGRLLTLQISAETIRQHFHYVRPSSPIGEGINVDDLRTTLTTKKPSLVILDGVTEAMTMHGLNPLDNKDIANFGRLLPRRIADFGPAVVCLDHLVKNREGQGRYALGGVHKLNGLDGAAFILENRKPFGIGLTGVTTVKIAKDRPGQLRKHGVRSKDGMFWFADLTLQSHDERWAEVEVVKPEERTADEFRPTGVMGQIARVLSEHESLSGKKIEALVHGRAATVRHAITLMQIEGYVSDGTPHVLLKPWAGGGSND